MNESIAPLERLEVPTTLDGRDGAFRISPFYCRIRANRDLEAVQLWLTQFEGSPNTYHTYRHAVERFYNWILVERKKALSSLSDEDFSAYLEFLNDPLPRERWVAWGHIRRSGAIWVPYLTPPRMSSRRLAMSVIRALTEWLRIVGYCDIGACLSRRICLLKGDPPSSPPTGLKCNGRGEHLRFKDWHMLRNSIFGKIDDEVTLQRRLVVQLLYFAGLSVVEVARVSGDDFLVEDGLLMLKVPSRGADFLPIYVVPPLRLAIERLNTVDIGGFTSQSFGISMVPSVSLACKPVIVRHLYQAFEHAARYAAVQGDHEAAGRLERLTAVQLKCAFELHAEELGAWQWVWRLIGARRLADQWLMQHLTPRKRLAPDDVQRGFSALAPCWGE